jgi:hypothetical protein
MPSDSSARPVGSLSAALAAVVREGERLRAGHDTVDLVLLSPVAREEVDDATAAIRATWRSPIEVVRVGAAPPRPTGTVELRAGPDDPLGVIGARLGTRGDGRTDSSGSDSSGAGRPRVAARLVRDTLTADDRAWARGRDRVLVEWPRRLAAADDSATGRADAVYLDVPGRPPIAVIGAFVRPSAPPLKAGSVVIARWADGAPAAVEESVERGGCLRTVHIGVPDVGDITLTPRFARLVEALVAPCGGAYSGELADDRAVAMLRVGAHADSARDAGARPVAEPSRASLAVRPVSESWLAPWLLGAALIMALIEPVVRRRST